MDNSNDLLDHQLDLMNTINPPAETQDISLDEYWSALEAIDVQYQALKSARSELQWYQGKFKEADELCKNANFEPIDLSALGQLTLLSSKNLSRSSMESALLRLREKLANLQNQKGEKNKTIAKLEQESQETLQNIRNRLKTLKDDLSASSSRITELQNRMKSLKTAQMNHVICLSAVCVVVMVFSKSLVAAGISTAIVFWFF